MKTGKSAALAIAATAVAAGAIGYRVYTDTPDENVAAATASADPLAALETEAKANSKDSGAWQRLGFAMFDQGRFADSAAAFEKAAALSPKHAVLWSSLGEALVMASEQDPMPPRAREAFRKAMALDPNDPRARYFQAVEKDLTGDHKGALDAWLELLADTPVGAPWEADLRRTIEQVGKIHKIGVDKQLAAVTAKRPAPTPAHPAFGAIPGPSQEQLAASGSIPPGDQRAMAEGMVAKLEGRLLTDPGNVDGWMMLMRSRKTLGQDAAAAKALADAISANPARKSELKAVAGQLGIRS